MARTPEILIRWAPIPGTAQEAFFDDDTPDANLLLRGGWGSGKTMTLVGKMLKLSALNAPHMGLWTVPDFGHIKDTILPMLSEVDETGHPWFLGPADYDYNAQSHCLSWRGGGPIQFVSAENAKSIAGPNAAFAGTDEPGDISYEAWRNTVARVRHVSARLRQKVAAGTNEDLGWLSELFGPDRPEYCHMYQMSTRDNVELTRRNPAYIREILAGASEAEVTAHLEGGIANLTSALAYPAFDAERQWLETVDPALPAFPLCVTFDFNVDPLVCVIGQVRAGPAGQEPHVVDGLTLRGGSTVDELTAALLDLYPTWLAGWRVYGDATGRAKHVRSLRSNYDLITEALRRSGPVSVRVPMANPPVARRINSVNRCCRNGLGQTQLYIRKTTPPRSCTTWALVQSLQRTQKKSGTDDLWKRPGDTVTHASDALGYWLDYEWPAEHPRTMAVSVHPQLYARPGPSLALQAIRKRKQEANHP